MNTVQLLEHRPMVGWLMILSSALTGAASAMAADAVSPTTHQATTSPAASYHVTFSTYFGGKKGELLRDMTADAEGNIYIAGSTGSDDFPRTPGGAAGQSAAGGGMVAKFSGAGAMLWSRVFTGEYLYSVKVDRAGGVLVAGRMRPAFPTTPGAFQPTSLHPCGFVGKLKPDASEWVWASYVGTGYAVRDMAMDDAGDVYCVLDYFAESKEVLPEGWFAKAFAKKPHGGGNHFGKSDAGIIKISNDGKVVWATWIGGSDGNDWVASLGVGTDRCPVVLLRTYSKDMPTTAGVFSRTPSEGWLGKLSADGSSLIFGSYIADAFPRTHNIAVDREGNVFLGTCTKSWPVTQGAFQRTFGGGAEDFGIAKFSQTGKLLAATYLGGRGHEINGPDQIAVGPEGEVVIAGSSSSDDYPITPGALQAHNAGAGGKYPYDGVVSIVSNDLSSLLYSSYVGGSGDDMARACFVGGDGTLYLGGVTTSRDFPTAKAFQEKYGGDPGYGSTPNGGSTPVGWGNGDCWLQKLVPLRSTDGKRPVK